jgi:5-hydroxyisourate hydrolase-like protein (transthyretin family)
MISAAFVGPAYAQPLDVTVQTDSGIYVRGTNMTVRGWVSCSVKKTPVRDATVTIEIHYPSPNTTVRTYPAELKTNSNGYFETYPDHPVIFSETAPTGTYKIVAKAKSEDGREGEGYAEVYLAISEETTEITGSLHVTVERGDGEEYLRGETATIECVVTDFVDPVGEATVDFVLRNPNRKVYVNSVVTNGEGRCITVYQLNQEATLGVWELEIRAHKEGWMDDYTRGQFGVAEHRRLQVVFVSVPEVLMPGQPFSLRVLVVGESGLSIAGANCGGYLRPWMSFDKTTDSLGMAVWQDILLKDFPVGKTYLLVDAKKEGYEPGFAHVEIQVGMEVSQLLTSSTGSNMTFIRTSTPAVSQLPTSLLNPFWAGLAAALAALLGILFWKRKGLLKGLRERNAPA